MASGPAVVIVLGVHRSGTSCMAGVLDRLGIPMGESGLRPNAGNPRGFYEDKGLRAILRQCGRVEFPGNILPVPWSRRVELFRNWRAARSEDGQIIGGKMPALCNMVCEMDAAWRGEWRAIVTERPIMDSARSRHRWHRTESLNKIARDLKRLSAKRDADLSRLAVPTIRIPFARLLANPGAIVMQVASFCGIQPTDEQVTSAISSVDQGLNHHTAL